MTGLGRVVCQCWGPPEVYYFLISKKSQSHCHAQFSPKPGGGTMVLHFSSHFIKLMDPYEREIWAMAVGRVFEFSKCRKSQGNFCPHLHRWQKGEVGMEKWCTIAKFQSGVGRYGLGEMLPRSECVGKSGNCNIFPWAVGRPRDPG